jgi:hypothetical protein
MSMCPGGNRPQLTAAERRKKKEAELLLSYGKLSDKESNKTLAQALFP